MRKGARNVLVLLALTAGASVASLALAEVVARLAGRQPFRPEVVRLRVEPGGRYQSADPRLGYRHLPGRFRITFPTGDAWTATHGPDTLRVSRPADRAPSSDRGLWIFGCSFVHGWGLDDRDTLPWKVQARLPDFDVRNFGVGGYGTLQSLLQFEEAAAGGSTPDVAVLAYAGFHDERNTRLRRWRRATFAYDRFGTTAQPYARFDRDGALRFGFDDGRYRDLRLLRRSALLTLLDDAYSVAEDRVQRSHAVSRRLVLDFEAAVRQRGDRFVLAGISREPGTAAMLAWAGSRGIPSVDLSVDLRAPGNGIPWDGHPSAVATDHFADTLVAFLRESALEQDETEDPRGNR